MGKLTAPSIKRVIVALDHSRQDANTLRQAVELAERAHAELVALFVEDEQLLQLAQLPFSQEISGASGVVRNLDQNAITRQMTRQVDELQHLLVQSVGSRAVHSTVKVVRGQFAVEALAEAGETDVVFVSVRSQGEQVPISVGWPLPRRFTPRAQRPKPVWVVYDGSPTADRALALASELSRLSGASLVVAIYTEDDQQARISRESVTRSLIGQTAPAQVFQYSAGQRGAFSDRLRDSGCGLLVIGQDDRFLRSAFGSIFVESFVCPVVLVR